MVLLYQSHLVVSGLWGYVVEHFLTMLQDYYYHLGVCFFWDRGRMQTVHTLYYRGKIKHMYLQQGIQQQQWQQEMVVFNAKLMRVDE